MIDNFVYHGKSLDLMDWNLHNLGDAETRRLHKDNITYNEWLDIQRGTSCKRDYKYD